MNDLEIEAVVVALQRCVGVLLDQVWQPARDRVLLGFADGTVLLLVPRGPDARLHTVTARPRNPARPFSFQGACRAHLGGPLRALSKEDGDRVVRLEFVGARLELRLTGRSGGLWLVAGDDVVAAYDGPAPPTLPPLPARAPRADPARFDTSGDADAAARVFFAAAERERSTADLRARVAQGLRRELQRLLRLLDHLGEDLARVDEAPALRRTADLLAASLHTVPRGASVVDAVDWETGETVSIALDPSMPPSATLDRLYRKARRLDRAGDTVLERMASAETAVAKARDQQQNIDVSSLDALGEIAASLPREGRGAPALPGQPWSEWTGPAGERVLVGRSAAGNRRLTFQVARGSDWWMHVRGRPGAHVVLPMASRDSTPPLELLLAAAQIALAQSHVAAGDTAEVQYTRIRDVRPVRGKEGSVTIADERVLRVTRDAAALAGWTRED